MAHNIRLSSFAPSRFNLHFSADCCATDVYDMSATVPTGDGVNSTPELDFLANSNSGIGIELELPSLELELESELRSAELDSELIAFHII